MKSSLAWGMLGTALLGLAGCDLAPRYQQPAVTVPTAFKEGAPLPAAWAAAQPRDDALGGRWWGIYGDQALDELEAKVTASNQTLAADEANVRAARAAAAVARAAMFPLVTTNPSVERVRSSSTWDSAPGVAAPPGGPSSSTGSGAILDEFTLPVDASYTVDLWRRLSNTAKAGALNAQATAADLATARLAVQSELAQDYFQLRALDAQKAILDDTVRSYRQALDVTNTLYTSGIDSDEDVARARNQLDTAVAQSTDTEVARAAMEHAIAVLTGVPPASFSLAPAPFATRPPAVPAGVPSQLLERRPDIAAAERRAAAANAEVGVARAAYFPDLTLGAAGGWESTQFSRWFEWPSRFWSVGPDLAATLFDGGARKAQTAQARAEFDAAAANYRQAVLSAFQGVEDNLAALRILSREAGEQHTAVETSRHLLDLAMSRYQSGIDSYLNVVTAQTDLLSNREAEVQVELREMTASVSLIVAIGGGWTRDELADAAPRSQVHPPSMTNS